MLYITIYLWQHFYDLSALVGCWSSVSIGKIIYKFLNVFHFDYTAVAVSGKVVRDLTTSVAVTAVTPTDRPKSVRNLCVIEVFGGVFYVVTMLFGLFCECRGFCHRTESELFLFVLHMFYLRQILSRTCRYFSGLGYSNIPPYFLDFPFSYQGKQYLYKGYFKFFHIAHICFP